ncbi:helix-turn-helix domain-containing protein, partial [[Lactobacillus] rogosae]
MIILLKQGGRYYVSTLHRRLQKKVVKAYMAGDKSIPQIAVEFNVAKSSVSKWVNEYKEECLYTTSTTA